MCYSPAMTHQEYLAKLTQDECYTALSTRDRRYDGRFFTAVLSTGIYCRPICPARTPKRENCLFLPTAAAAEAAGFRPCLRCRPEVAPHLPGWQGTSATVSRALRLIEEGALNDGSLEELSNRVGLGARHLRRLFEQHLGASPKQIATTRRLLFAKQLITETALPLTEVALAAGFNSLRRFNDAFKRAYKMTPRDMRRYTPSAPEGEARLLTLRLDYAPPFDWHGLIAFWKPRAISGIEHISATGYGRNFIFQGKRGRFHIEHCPQNHLLYARIDYPDITVLPLLVAKIRRLFDLDSPVSAIAEFLQRDALLAPLIRHYGTLRIPGCWDPFEMTVRAVLGQQVSVKGATTLISRLVRLCNGLPPQPAPSQNTDQETDLVFPTPHQVAKANLGCIGLPRARQRTLRELAETVAERPDFFQSGHTVDDIVTRLCRIRGIGPWTANYVAMRALGETDAFPAADLGLLKACALNGRKPSSQELLKRAEAWRPFRAYAALYLWASLTQDTTGEKPHDLLHC